MIEVLQERCTGCGHCVELCPAGALTIDGGHAVVDHTLCRHCETCISACPQGALAAAGAPIIAAPEPRLPQARPVTVIDVRPAPAAPVPWTRRVLPVLADVVSFAGREVLPHVLEVLASAPAKRAPSRTGTAPAGEQGSAGGRQSRQRYRGRHGQS